MSSVCLWFDELMLGLNSIPRDGLTEINRRVMELGLWDLESHGCRQVLILHLHVRVSRSMHRLTQSVTHGDQMCCSRFLGLTANLMRWKPSHNTLSKCLSCIKLLKSVILQFSRTIMTFAPKSLESGLDGVDEAPMTGCSGNSYSHGDPLALPVYSHDTCTFCVRFCEVHGDTNCGAAHLSFTAVGIHQTTALSRGGCGGAGLGLWCQQARR